MKIISLNRIEKRKQTHNPNAGIDTDKHCAILYRWIIRVVYNEKLYQRRCRGCYHRIIKADYLEYFLNCGSKNQISIAIPFSFGEKKIIIQTVKGMKRSFNEINI